MLATYHRRTITKSHERFLLSETHNIYLSYKQHAIDTKTLPLPALFYENILKAQGYAMTYTGFLYHWYKLQRTRIPYTQDYYIMVDENTKAIRLPEIDIVEKDSDV